MNRHTQPCSSLRPSCGFSLIEVVLAIGIFLVTVLALVGLLGPTLQSVDEVEKTDEVSSIVNTVNAFLQNSPDIAPTGSSFDAIYEAVVRDGSATLLVFRAYEGVNDVISLNVGFVGETDAIVDTGNIVSSGQVNAAGTIYRVVLSPSSVTPLAYHHATESKTVNGATVVVPKRDTSTNVYKLANTYLDVLNYDEGSFAMEVRIFAEEPTLGFNAARSLTDLALEEPIFTYNTAIVR